LLFQYAFWYSSAMSTYEKPVVRSACGAVFTDCFRWVLYNHQLTWGAKCLALAFFDVPPSEKIFLAKLARKLGVSTATAVGWKKQLLALKFPPLMEIPETN